MPTIHVFEPALCCNTGVCGPDVDQALVDFTADLGMEIWYGALGPVSGKDSSMLQSTIREFQPGAVNRW